MEPLAATADLAAPGINGETTVLRLGYVPLIDAAPLLVAQHKGFFARHDLTVELARVAAWASIRDRVLFGVLDGAQMLSPMPLAAAQLPTGTDGPLAVVATLGRNGNTVTLGASLLREIREAAPDQAHLFPLPATALAAALAHRRNAGRKPPVIAVVFPFSSHNYLLRYWLATGGIDADRDVRLTVAPPPLVADYLADGVIEGFCAGEPWGSRAVDLRAGEVVLTSSDIWRNHPEKVLAFPGGVIERDPARVVACIAALLEAGRWLDAPDNHEEAAALLCEHTLTGVPPGLVLQALRGQLQVAPDTAPIATPPITFHRNAASFPFVSQGAWWLGQMRRWGHLSNVAIDDAELVRRTWRSDLWRSAAAALGEDQPLTDGKQEGGHAAPWQLAGLQGTVDMAPDVFIDGAVFPEPPP